MRTVQVFLFLLLYAFSALSSSAKGIVHIHPRGNISIQPRTTARRPQQPAVRPQTETNFVANMVTNAAPRSASPPPVQQYAEPVTASTNWLAAAPLVRPAPRSTNAPAKRERGASERPASIIEMHYETNDPLLGFQQANAAKGFPESQYAMGLRYMSGIGVPKDEEKAREFLEAAAKRGNTKAKEKLRELRRAQQSSESAELASSSPGL